LWQPRSAHSDSFAYIAASRWFERLDATMFLFLGVVCLFRSFHQEGWFDVDPTRSCSSFLLQFAGMFQWCMQLSAGCQPNGLCRAEYCSLVDREMLPCWNLIRLFWAGRWRDAIEIKIFLYAIDLHATKDT
jgi:hypothetical protein